jgi:uncharacterized protein YjbI with pentapeptide repeats
MPSKKTKKSKKPRIPKWLADTFIGLSVGIVAGIVSGLIVAAQQSNVDDARAAREAKAAENVNAQSIRLENLRFVRDRSGPTRMERPFEDLDLTLMTMSGLALQGADFRYAELKDTYFADSDLRGAEFALAQFDDTNFKSADLSGATLDRIGGGLNPRIGPLEGAQLVSASLVSARFEGYDLAGANLTGAILDYADLSNAVLDLVTLVGVCYDTHTTWPKGFTPPPSVDPAVCEAAHDRLYAASR